jgi:shikimate dehydrogenase
VLIGTGGAARAGLAALKSCGASQLRLIARNKESAEALLDDFPVRGAAFAFEDAEDAIGGCAGIVNATPLGMDGYPAMPDLVLQALEKAGPKGFALDMVYAPLRTRFLARAEEAGLATIDGLAMLIGQAAEAFCYFYGADAPRQHDPELRELLCR